MMLVIWHVNSHPQPRPLNGSGFPYRIGDYSKSNGPRMDILGSSNDSVKYDLLYASEGPLRTIVVVCQDVSVVRELLTHVGIWYTYMAH